MKKHILFQLALCLFTVTHNLHAQGTAFTYQGQLQNNGTPATGTYDLTFSLFNVTNGGSALAGPLTNSNIGVTNGLFIVQLDFGSAFGGSNRWLEISVRTNGASTFTTLTPRQQITPSPYALYAPNAGTALTAGSANSVLAANISGTIPLSQLPVALVTNGAAGLTLAGTFAGNGANVTNVNAVSLGGLNATNFLRTGGNGASLNYTNISGAFAQLTGNGGGGGAQVTLDLTTYSPLANNAPSSRIQATDEGNYSSGLDFYTKIPGDPANPLASRLHLTADGRIGMGTLNPQGSLHIYSDNNPTVVRLQSSGTPGFGRLEFVSNPQGDPGEWRPGFIQSTDNGGFTGGLAFSVNGTGTANKFGANEVMRLVDGRVGIGTPTPAVSLHLREPESRLWLESTSSTAFTETAYLTDTRAWNTGVGGSGVGNGLNSKYYIYDATAGQTRFLVDTTGNVGIGTITPASALQVAGTVTANSFNGPGALPWATVAGTTQSAQPNVGYLLNNDSPVTVTLPPSPNPGDVLRITGTGAGGWKVSQNAGQSVLAKNLSGNPNVTWTPRASSQLWFGVASSADGSKLVAVANGDHIYTSTDSGFSWTPRSSAQNWNSVASSADGVKLVAVVNGGFIWTSTDAGVTWSARATSQNWFCVASSADGSKLVAGVEGGQLYTSIDSGVTWTPRASSLNWFTVASSADGVKLVAVAADSSGGVYTSTDSGVTWTPRFSASFDAVTSSADGTKLAATLYHGQIYTSTDSGVTWTPRASNQTWNSIASSADGNNLVAVVAHGQIYISTDSGITWTPRASTQSWYWVASSADGSKLVAVVAGGEIYPSSPGSVTGTTVGTAGYLRGEPDAAIELQYVGNGQFLPISHEGLIGAF